jgi:phage terminase Nu1 subunit (DNA packaging protein)
MALSESSLRQLDLIGRHTAAKILGITIRTLQRWHHQGIGPQRKNWKSDRPIQYSRTEVEEWAAANK